jgi:RNA polymerase sigma factor (sigma-70 family)
MEHAQFMKLMNENRRIMYKLCNFYCDTNDHNDVIQNIMLECWNSVKNFRGDSKFSTWMYAISRNVCISFRRQQVKRIVAEELWPDTDVIDEEMGAREKATLQMQEAAKYQTIIDNLNENDRSLLLMYVEGMSYAEISEKVGISENSLRVTIHRIKRRLYLRYKEK